MTTDFAEKILNKQMSNWVSFEEVLFVETNKIFNFLRTRDYDVPII